MRALAIIFLIPLACAGLGVPDHSWFTQEWPYGGRDDIYHRCFPAKFKEGQLLEITRISESYDWKVKRRNPPIELGDKIFKHQCEEWLLKAIGMDPEDA